MRIGIDARFYGPTRTGPGRYTQKLVDYLQEIDKKNERFKYDSIGAFENGLAKATLDGNSGLINADGTFFKTP